MQSLRALAGAGARAIMIIDCFVDTVIKKNPPSGCPTDPLSSAEKQAIAPFLFNGGLTPTLSASAGASPITVTASQPGFTMMFSSDMGHVIQCAERVHQNSVLIAAASSWDDSQESVAIPQQL